MTIEKNTISCIKKRKKMVLYTYMGNDIDDKTLQEAKEKLACKIEPSTYTDGNTAGGSSCAPGGQAAFIDPTGKVMLTRMTSAGG